MLVLIRTSATTQKLQYDNNKNRSYFILPYDRLNLVLSILKLHDHKKHDNEFHMETLNDCMILPTSKKFLIYSMAFVMSCSYHRNAGISLFITLITFAFYL